MFQILILTFVVNIALAAVAAFALQPTLPSSSAAAPIVLTHPAFSSHKVKDGTVRACVIPSVVRFPLPYHLTAETPRVPTLLSDLPEPLSCLAASGRSAKFLVTRLAGVGI